MPPLPYIDLHTHSTCSDGTLSPTALVDLACHRRLSAIALTDHDTVTGVDQALARGQEIGVEVLPGIEISCHLKQCAMHLLGYGFNHHHPELLDFIEELQQNRHERNQGLRLRLEELGIVISPEELKRSGGSQFGRPHFARLLVEKGFVKNLQEAFARYLRCGGLAFVEQQKPSAEAVINRIHAAGGLVFLAHPACTDPSLEKLPDLIARLREQGLDGIEVYYPTHSNKIRNLLIKIADEHRLLLSGGTDFHGDGSSSVPLGGNIKTVRVPLALYRTITDRLCCAVSE